MNGYELQPVPNFRVFPVSGLCKSLIQVTPDKLMHTEYTVEGYDMHRFIKGHLITQPKCGYILRWLHTLSPARSTAYSAVISLNPQTTTIKKNKGAATSNSIDAIHSFRSLVTMELLKYMYSMCWSNQLRIPLPLPTHLRATVPPPLPHMQKLKVLGRRFLCAPNCYPNFDASIAGRTGEEALPRRVKQKETIDDDCFLYLSILSFYSFCSVYRGVREQLEREEIESGESKARKGSAKRREEKRSEERNGKNGHKQAAPGTSKAMTEMDEIQMNDVFLLHRLRRCPFIH